MRVFTTIAILATCLTALSCGRIYGPVKEVEAYSSAKEPVFDDMTKAVMDDPTVTGVDKASKLWEGKKADLKAKRDAIDSAPQGFNSDWQSVYFKSQDRTRTQLRTMSTAVISDDAASAKFKTLESDVETTLKLK